MLFQTFRQCVILGLMLFQIFRQCVILCFALFTLIHWFIFIGSLISVVNWKELNLLTCSLTCVLFAETCRLLDSDLQSVLRSGEDFDVNRLPFLLEAG